MNSILKFFTEKAIPILIQYTIGLLFPWWLIDLINRMLIDGYGSKFLSFSKWERYSLGLVLPWWTLLVFSGNKMQVSDSEEPSGKNDDRSSDGSKLKNWYCARCGQHIEYKNIPSGVGGRCSGSNASNSSHEWRDLGNVGKFTSTCDLCSTTINHKSQTIHSSKCANGPQHKWRKK